MSILSYRNNILYLNITLCLLSPLLFSESITANIQLKMHFYIPWACESGTASYKVWWAEQLSSKSMPSYHLSNFKCSSGFLIINCDESAAIFPGWLLVFMKLIFWFIWSRLLIEVCFVIIWYEHLKIENSLLVFYGAQSGRAIVKYNLS